MAPPPPVSDPAGAAPTADLARENEALGRELAEARQQIAATAGIIKAISRSTFDLQSVLDSLVESAARLCDADIAAITRPHGDAWLMVSTFGFGAEITPLLKDAPIPHGRGSISGRTILALKPVHIHDVDADPEYTFDGPQRRSGYRTMLGVPLMRDDVPLGVLVLGRKRVRPFADRQIDLVTTFADQAVIAIENVRLFNDVQARTVDLTESLQQQTATADVLKIVSRSTFDLQSVLDTLTESAARLCGADMASITRQIGTGYFHVASHDFPDDWVEFTKDIPLQPGRGSVVGRALLEGRPVQVPDVLADPEYTYLEPQRKAGYRTFLAVPLLRDGTPIGVLALCRRAVAPFSDRQIALVETFADQAVIAIENVRLFDEVQARTAELTESLQQQTATAEVLKVISRSSFDLPAVLGVLVESAARLCDAEKAFIFQRDGDLYRLAANYGFSREMEDYAKHNPIVAGRGTVTGRAAQECRTVHIPDVLADPDYTGMGFQDRGGYRTNLGVPMMRDGIVIGVFTLTRPTVRPFSAAQIDLVTTFADQAVIAIENVRLFEAVQARTRALGEALERQTATSEVLSVISRSTYQIQPVFDTIVQTASRLCEAEFALIFKLQDGLYHPVASNNAAEALVRYATEHPIAPGRGSMIGRTVLERRSVHIPDCLEDPEYTLREYQGVGKFRSMLGVPLLRDGVPIGAIGLLRAAVKPFTETQIELVTTFADQAVIAIENVRLFEEVQARTSEVTESLERQTATSEVLGVISRSAYRVEPVFDAIVATAARLCRADWAVIRRLAADGKHHVVAHHCGQPEFLDFVSRVPIAPGRGSAASRALLGRQTVHIPDVAADPAYTWSEAQAIGRFRAVLCVPLLRESEPIGVISLVRTEAEPFSATQIELVTTFADQAVIAIENARLFEEVQAKTRDITEALTYQTGSSNILRVIASSPTDVGPVLEAIAENARDICDAYDVAVLLKDGDDLRFEAHRGPIPIGLEKWPINRNWTAGRAFLDRKPVHVHDLLGDEGAEFPDGRELSRRMGHRSILSVPLMRESESVGVIVLRRTEVHPFSAKQIALLQTFADQAVIAIENVRLFEELQARTHELSGALEQQTATAEVLGIISSSPSDLDPVFQAMLANATRICEAKFGVLFEYADGKFRALSSLGVPPGFAEYLSVSRVWSPDTGLGRIAGTMQIVHIADTHDDPAYAQHDPDRLASIDLGGVRSFLGVPMLKDGALVGAIVIFRQEMRPFADRQMALLRSFAEQAVIAIENVRLLAELRESLKQQTATADVLKVISRSTFDLQTVLRTLLESAVHLCEADQGTITRQKDGRFYRAEAVGFSPAFLEAVKDVPVVPDRSSTTGRALLEGRIVHIPDVRADPDYTFAQALTLGNFRATLGVPMMKEGKAIGVLAFTRREPRPFTDKQIELVTTFADQAAIAIENVRLFEQAEARARELARSLEELRSAQDRLVQTEKLASLGQLTAGIAHEIKNPLNFVNNFAALSAELIDELRQTLDQAALPAVVQEDIAEVTGMLRGNLEKIVQHGKRADSIVKNMLLHSREGSGEHRPVDINAIVEEGLNLAYHGARAEKRDFNVTLERAFDPAAGEVDLFPQEITRVLLNLIANGFYATMKRKAAEGDGYAPTLSARTRNLGDKVEIVIRDNGTGIPASVKEKIFNPFFTTKPAGEGTGLGLSLSHDIIVKQHAGSIEVETEPGAFTLFRIVLPRAAASLGKSGV